MTVRSIRTGDDPVLRRACKTVTKFGPHLDDFVQDMFDTMYNAKGRGLAAPQIGLAIRVFVMDATWKEGKPDPLAVVNPEIISTEGPMVVGMEQCLSLPGKTYGVQRPLNLEMRWQSPNETQQTFKFWSTEARIIAHEVEHLEGKLISDVGMETGAD